MDDSIANYKRQEYQVLEKLVEIRKIYKSCEMESGNIECIEQAIELLKSKRFYVAVVGEFKRGKTTLINALLGSKVLPADVTPATATINRITYGNMPSVTIFYKSGKRESISIEELIDYVTMLTPQGISKAPLINEAVIQYPVPLCQNHIEIIDTPGLCDNSEMTEITIKVLKSVDAAIITISSLTPFSETECKFVVELVAEQNIASIIFVVTRMDEIDEDEHEKLLTAIRKRINENTIALLKDKYAERTQDVDRIAQIIAAAPLFGISAMFYLKSCIKPDKKMAERSNFEPFVNELYKILTARQGIHALETSLERVIRCCKDFYTLSEKMLTERESALKNCSSMFNTVEDYASRKINKLSITLKSKLDNVEKLTYTIAQIKNDCASRFLKILTTLSDINKISPESEQWKSLSQVPLLCWEIINNNYSSTILFLIKDVINDVLFGFKPIREEYLLKPAYGFKKLYPRLKWQQENLLESDIVPFMKLFGLPVFSWQTPPLPVQSSISKDVLFSTIIKAVDKSVEVYHQHWKIYLDGITKRIINLFYKEAEDLKSCFKEIEELLPVENERLEFLRQMIKDESHNIDNICSHANADKRRILELI